MGTALDMLAAEVLQGHVVDAVRPNPRAAHPTLVVRVADNANVVRWCFLQAHDGSWYYGGPWDAWISHTALPPLRVRHDGLVQWLEDHTKVGL